MLGVHELLMARVLLVFVIPVTFMVHDIWTIEQDTPVSGLSRSVSTAVARRDIPNFPSEFDNEFVHFFKNVGMVRRMRQSLLGGGARVLLR